MSLFDWSGSDGCTSHHFEVSRTKKSNFRVRWDNPCYVLERKATLKCQHEGCYEKKKKYVEQQRYYLEKDDNGDFVDQGMAELNEVLRWMQNEAERE